MRKNQTTRKVRRAYNQDQLARICTMPERRFGRAFGMATVNITTSRKRFYDEPAADYYHFRDNGSRVLAVAHLDTVVRPERRTPHFRNTRSGPYIRSGALDDRLGAYVILRLLPALGVTCDWLLTVGEESGASTAGDFKPGKDYDWVIEFDRTGTDVVMYQYEDRTSRRLVEAAGAEMGSGSFSDIAYLEHLGVKAFNWGVGYRGNYHSEDGYAYLNDTFAMVARYLRFHEQNAGTAMPHDADDYDAGYDRYEECYTCGEKRVVDSATGYCTFCGACSDCGGTDPDVAHEWDDPDADVCQCYTPRSAQPAAPSIWEQGMTWEEYLAKRNARDARAEDACQDCERGPDACTCALDEDTADERVTTTKAGGLAIDHTRCIMAGPDTPASHSHAGQTGQWVAARRSPSIAPAWSEHAVQADRRAYDGWHEAVWNKDGLGCVGAHNPGAGWSDVCARCAARWPASTAQDTALAILDSHTLSVSDR